MKTERIYYAIGDVHGEAERLEALHHLVFKDWKSQQDGRPMTLVHLGDYVDRGEDSRGVIARIMALERHMADVAEVELISLRGNHEQMLLEAVEEGPDSYARTLWLNNGGDRAIESYRLPGIASSDHEVDPIHVSWLETLPDIWTAEDGRLIFVHAGIEPREYPDDRIDIHLWTRSPRFFRSEDWRNPVLDNAMVVHGHTPTENFEPDVSSDQRRVNVDTGAVYGGALTAVVIEELGGPVRFLRS